MTRTTGLEWAVMWSPDSIMDRIVDGGGGGKESMWKTRETRAEGEKNFDKNVLVQ